MTEYIYTARTPSGEKVTDLILAENRKEAFRILANKKFIVLDLRENKNSNFMSTDLFDGLFKIKDAVFINFVKKFTFLVKSGIPIFQSLKILADQIKDRRMRNQIRDVLEHLNNGESLSEALSHYPRTFSALFVNAVRVGEQSGQVVYALEGIKEYLEKESGFKSKVRSAMTYPIVMVMVCILVIVIMMTFVFPRFMEIFQEMGTQVPPATQRLMQVSEFFGHNFIKIIVVLVGTVLVLRVALNRPDIRLSWDRYKLKFPVLGPLLEKFMLVRATRTLAVLVQTGVPLVNALIITKDVSENAYVASQMQHVIEAVKEGGRLSQAMERASIFPSFVTDTVAIGEKGGILADVLHDLANQFDLEASENAERLSTLIEPIMIVILGLMLLFMAMAIILPMFQIVGNMHHGGM